MHKHQERLAAVALVLTVLTGCANTTPDAVAYKTVGSVIVTVDTAMKGWGDYVRAHGRCTLQPTPTSPAQPAGCVTLDSENRVRAFYGQYQIAMDAAQKSITAWHSIAAANPNADPASLNAAIGAVSEAAAAVVNVVIAMKGV